MYTKGLSFQPIAISFHFHFGSHSYNNLNNVVINRGKLLQTAVHSLQLFDRSMDQVSVLRLFTSIGI